MPSNIKMGKERKQPAFEDLELRIDSTKQPAHSEPQAVKGWLHAGDLCPQCQSARLEYDGLLNLSCPNCGTIVGGCFT
jgi:hypothetical protein